MVIAAHLRFRESEKEKIERTLRDKGIRIRELGIDIEDSADAKIAKLGIRRILLDELRISPSLMLEYRYFFSPLLNSISPPEY